MGRYVVLSCVLLAVAATDSHDKMRVIQPARQIVLSGPRGASVFYQIWLPRHRDNRWVQLEVWDGDLRIQSSGWSIEGEHDAQIQPTMRPLAVHLAPGRYDFRALACSSVTEQNQCGKVRQSVTMPMRVCAGGDVEGC